MKISDATRLAYTKYRAKKVRSILTVIGSAFLVAILLFMTLASTGLKNSVGNAGSAKKLREMVLASTTVYNFQSGDDALNKSVSEEAKRLENAGFKPRAIYKSVLVGNNVTSSDLGVSQNFFGGTISLTAQDTDLMVANVQNGEALKSKTSSNALPVLVSIEAVTANYSQELSKLKDEAKRQKRIDEIKKDISSRDIKIKFTVSKNQLTEQKNPDGSSYSEISAVDSKDYEKTVRIVSFLPDPTSFLSSLSGSFGGFYGSTVVVPIELVKNEDFAQDLKNTPASQIFVSLKDSEERKNFLEKFGDFSEQSLGASTSPYSIYGDVVSSVNQYTDSIKNVFKGFVIVMLIFVTLPMSGTISKVLADAQRETGVFRAIGAKRRDVFHIYLTYSVILATLAVLVAFAVASIICLILTAKYGPSLSAELSAISGNSDSYKVVLFGINPGHLAFIYALTAASAMLGVVGPVLKTLRKDPVVAMRED